MNNLLPDLISDPLTVSQDLSASAERIRTLLQNIEARNKRNLEDAVNIGQELHKVKRSLDHGEFGSWLLAEFGMSRTSATRYMQVAAYFADKLSTMDNLPPLSVAFLLAQVSTPDNVRLAVLSGELPADIPSIRIAIEAEKKRYIPPPRSTEETGKEPWYEGLSDETIAKLEEAAQRIKGRMKEAVKEWLGFGRGFNELKSTLSLEQLFSLAWQEYHMTREEASVLMLYAESYGFTPIEQVPWEVITAIFEQATDYLFSKDEDLKALRR